MVDAKWLEHPDTLFIWVALSDGLGLVRRWCEAYRDDVPCGDGIMLTDLGLRVAEHMCNCYDTYGVLSMAKMRPHMEPDELAITEAAIAYFRS